MTGELPIIGEVRRFADDAIDIGLPSGEAVTLSIDEDTYCRWTAGKRLSTRDLQKLLKVGDRLLASAKAGHAISLRPPRCTAAARLPAATPPTLCPYKGAIMASLTMPDHSKVRRGFSPNRRLVGKKCL